MLRLIIRRVITAPFILAGVMLVVFITTQVMPADPVSEYLGQENLDATPAVRAAVAHRLGLDQSFWTQLGKYYDRLLHGDLGVSPRYLLPVKQLLGPAIPASFILILCGALVAFVGTAALGVLCARYRNRWPDLLGRTIATVGMSTPPFFLAILLILLFGVYLNVLPISGRGDPPDITHLILPSLVLGLHEMGSGARILRASMIDALNEDYTRAARGRGIRPRTILVNGALRNALLPAVTDFAVSMAEMTGTLVLVESVFGWPGVGNLLGQAIVNNDGPLIIGTVLILTVYTMTMNLLTDILYRVIDPRLRG